MKLTSIQIRDTIPGLGTLTNVSVNDPPNVLRGWRVSVRGPSVFLISPAGWTFENRNTPATRKADGPPMTFEVPRASCVLMWEGADLDATGKFDSQPMWTERERVEMATEAKAKPKS